VAPLRVAAQVTITAQDRSVEASSQSYGGLWDETQNPFFPDFEGPAQSFTNTASDAEAAPDTAPFSAAASTVDPPIVLLAPQGSATATQTSSLGTASIDASGSVDANGHSRPLTQGELDLANLYFHPPVPYNFGTLGDDEGGGSHFSVSFDVATPTPYALGASVGLSAAERETDDYPGFERTSGAAMVELTGPSGSVAAIAIDQLDFCPLFAPCVPGSDSLAAEGTLAPGSYTLSASASASAWGGCSELPGYTDFQCYAPAADGSFDLSLALGATPVPSLSPGGLLALASVLLASGATLRRTRRAGAAGNR
jgi:hypothetical protein